MVKKNNWKVGDKVIARLFGGGSTTGVIENIEYDEYKDDWVADLDSGHWVYLSQIHRKVG